MMIKRSGETSRAKPRQLLNQDIESQSKDSDTQIVLALSRGLDILDAFRRTDMGLGNADFADRTGMTKPTVSRLTYTLTKRRYLHYDARTRVYRLGVKAAALGAIAQASTNIRILAPPLMRQLALASGCNVALGTPDATQIVLVDSCEGNAVVGLRLLPGTRVPVATSAIGRAYIASLEPTARDELIAQIRQSYNKTEWSRLARGIEQASRDLMADGFCLSLGDWEKDVHACAVPICAMPGQPAYVVNLGGPAYSLTESDIRIREGPRLVEMVRTLESSLGMEFTS